MLWGFEGARPFTVLDARMRVGFDLLLQKYEATHILWDAHIRGFDTPAEAVRIALPIRWTGWANEEPVRMDDGHVSAWSDGNQPGLVWVPDKPNTVRNFTQRFPPIVTTLFQLWTGNKTTPCTIQIRIENVGWCTLKSTLVPSASLTQPLLGLDKLTLLVVSKWLLMQHILGPLPFMAVHDGTVLQVDTQMLATALEGSHRRLNPGAKRFQGLVSNGLLNRARKAATEAAVAVLTGTVTAADAKLAYNEALGHVTEPSYAARIAELLPGIERVAPGLLGPSISAWIDDMKDLRNVQGHGLKTHDDFGETEISRYYVLASSGRWVLKILLLLELIDEEHIALALLESEQFKLALANIDREMYWKDFSAHGYFLEALDIEKR